MAKKLKKFLALVTAFALCAGQLALPAMATEAEEQTQQTTIDVVITSQDTSVEHDPAAGEIVTTTTTKTEWDGTTESGSVVTGGETITEFIAHDDYNGDALYEGGTTEGRETETTTITETETQKQEDVLIDETFTDLTDHEERDSDPVQEDTGWVEDGTDHGQWAEGEWIEGDFVSIDGMAYEDTGEYPLHLEGPEDVTIHLKPGQTKTVTETISAQEILEKNLEIPTGGTRDILDETGNVIGTEVTTVTEIVENGLVVGYERTVTATAKISEETVTGDTVENTPSGHTSSGSKPALPEGVEAGTRDVLDDSGSKIGEVTTEITEKLDEAGNVIGYIITKTTTTDVTTEESEISDAETTTDVKTHVEVVLPERPAEAQTLDEATGITTLVTVSDILDENGNITGYEVVTTKTDENGNLLAKATEKLRGTVTTTATTITDPTSIETTTNTQKTVVEVMEIEGTKDTRQVELVTERLTTVVNSVMTEKNYEFIEIDGQLYFIFTGSMGVAEGAGHGDTSLMNPVAPQQSLVSGSGLSALDLYYRVNGGGGNYSGDANPGEAIPEDGFKLIGNGMASNLVVGTAKGSTIVHQFKLRSSDGKTFYAYCVDMATSAQPGYFYDIEDVSSDDYFRTDAGDTVADSVEKIRTIALNAFWGTASGIGSLDSVKALVKDYLMENGRSEAQAQSIVNGLTPGQAVAATQAALWKYGSSSSESRVNENDLLKYYYNNGNYNSLGNSNTDYIYTEYIYKALLDSADEPIDNAYAGVEFLDAEDVTAGSITIRDKVEDADENYDEDTGNDVYNTDISFTLNIEPSKLNGDLIVTVLVDGQEVKRARLDTQESFFSFGIDPDGNGVYTIKDVELAEGVTVNLNLSGTQNLGTGVYVYNSEVINDVPSQTLVGLATGERKVNLDISMRFNAEEPEVIKTDVYTSDQGTRTDTKLDIRTDVRNESKVTTTTEKSTGTTTGGTAHTRYYADVTVETVKVTEIVEERSWFDSWLKYFEKDTDEHDGDEGWDDEDEEEIEDEEVPLASAPKTGDISFLLAGVSLISLGGMVLLRKRDEE